MSEMARLTNPVAHLERVPVRERGGSQTRSAWRVLVTASEGLGTIVRIEAEGRAVHFRGDGLFLGASPEEMAAAWEALARSDAPPEPELPQLG
jgi:hypothetical protein